MMLLARVRKTTDTAHVIQVFRVTLNMNDWAIKAESSSHLSLTQTKITKI